MANRVVASGYVTITVLAVLPLTIWIPASSHPEEAQRVAALNAMAASCTVPVSMQSIAEVSTPTATSTATNTPIAPTPTRTPTNTPTPTPRNSLTVATQVGGTATYGDTTATLTVTVRCQGSGGPVPVGGQVAFTFFGQTYQAATNAQGVATVTVPLPLGLSAGTYRGYVQANYAGTTGYDLSFGSGPLVIARRVLWVKASDRTVGLKQPNPAATPPANCLAAATATTACGLELANGTDFLSGDDWSSPTCASRIAAIIPAATPARRSTRPTKSAPPVS